MIRHVGVVIPARDEEALIARCLTAVAEAVRAVDVTVSVVVVADGCLDRTAEIARGFPGVRVLEIESSNVGAAREAGARAAVELGAEWLANTDADSVVPPNWLVEQLALAAVGADIVVGTVRPDFSELTAAQIEAWQASHTPGEPNGHVHGANLGVRTASYLAAGGYRALPEHEDVDLVDRLSEVGSVVASDAGEVITSARLFGRTPGGYARYLREEMFAARQALR